MSEFEDALDRIGLLGYLSRFIAEGFDSWETLLDIQESDLEALNVKLGHRRKLQRAIADSKQDQGYLSLTHQSSNGSAKESVRGKDSFEANDHPTARPKRRYKRHPKPDTNAPERPVSAYVLFSNNVREKLKSKGQELNFCDMAKVVGEQWQNLPMEEREAYENYAATKKADYNAQLAEYKKTEPYRDYQRYLAKFKANHKDTAASPEARNPETRRTKLVHENSTSSSTGGTERTGSLSSTEPSLSHQGSIASPSSMSVHSELNSRSEVPPPVSTPGDLYGPVKPPQSSTHSAQLGRPDVRIQPFEQLPHVYPEAPAQFQRRRSSSHSLISAPQGGSILTSSPLNPVHDSLPSLPPMRISNDSSRTMRALPPPIPTLGSQSSMSSDPIPLPRKHDPMDALIAAAESQAPRASLPHDSQRRG